MFDGISIQTPNINDTKAATNSINHTTVINATINCLTMYIVKLCGCLA